VRIDPAALQKWIESLACQAGVDSKEASVLAEVLTWSDMVGRPEQGVWRLPSYLKRFKHGLINSPCQPRTVAERKAVVVIDGDNGFGQLLGRLAMRRAMDLAADYGVGFVGVRRSNHFGPAAYYVNLAAERGYVGLAFTNAVPKVAPPGGSARVLGTNPLALGAPVRSGRAILVDLSTSASAGAKVRRAAESGDRIPAGVARDAQGRDVSDAREAMTGMLEPVGGPKGFALGFMVEILSAVLTGAAISHEVASLYEDFSRPNGVGHAFVALDIAALMPREEYLDRIEKLANFARFANDPSGSGEPSIPGARRWRTYEKQAAEGVELDERTFRALSAVSQELGVSAPC